MTNLGILYGFEIRKILRRKIVWISLILMAIITVMSVSAALLGSYHVDGVIVDTRYHMFQVDSAYEKALSGRTIDQELLEEMKVGYDKIPKDVERYSLTEEYQTYARPYSAVFNFARQSMGITVSEMMEWNANEQDMYEQRQYKLEKVWQNYMLTPDEKLFWKIQEEKLKQPFIFQYAEGYVRLFGLMYSTGLLLVILVVICLSDVFPKEHVRKTDQQILSSKYGRDAVYWAKFLAGISFGFCISLLLVVMTFAITFLLYGGEGFSSAIQLLVPECSLALSIGQIVVIGYGGIILTGVFVSVIVMVLSEFLHSNMATLSLCVAVIILCMFITVSTPYRIINQLWSFMPTEYVGDWTITNPWTIPIFGKVFLPWQIGPVVYGILGVLLAFLGKRRFNGYQISGR